MFLLGLGTSLHCVSMCGPLVLTYAVKGAEKGPWYRKLTPNVAYQLAQVVSYMLIGLLLGAIGSFVNFDALRPYVMFLAGAFMIVLGLGMTGKVPWALRLVPKPPAWLMTALSKIRKRSVSDAAAGESTLATPITLGLMTGLLPCGPLMAAQVSAAASGSPLAGAAGMAAFALGTAPLMVAFGTAGSLIPRAWKERMMLGLAVLVMVFGAVFINRGLLLTGLPNFNTVKRAFTAAPAAKTDTPLKTAADGVVEVPLVIENTTYNPATLRIPADKPVRIVVDRREASACSDRLVLPQLGVDVALAPNGVTTVNVPATKAGNYTMTCGMGMMSGTLVVGDAVASGSSSATPLFLVVGLVGIAGIAVARKRKAPAPAPASKRTGSQANHAENGKILGFTPAEALLVGAIVLAAVGAGLAAGGYLHL
jgi:sulfite exporter TauE/SafE